MRLVLRFSALEAVDHANDAQRAVRVREPHQPRRLDHGSAAVHAGRTAT